MSIGNWARSTPGATSVTASPAGSCSCFGGRGAITRPRAGSCRRWRWPPCDGAHRRRPRAGYRESITGRSTPDSNSGSTSAAKRWHERDLLLERPGAQRGPDPGDALDEQQPDVDRRLSAAHQPDLHDGALGADRLEVAVDLLAPDDVEHDVDAVRHRPLEFGEPVVRAAHEHQVGAEHPARVDLAGRARHRDARTDRLGDLDRGGADTGRAGVDERPPPARQPTLHDERVPCGEEHLRDRRPRPRSRSRRGSAAPGGSGSRRAPRSTRPTRCPSRGRRSPSSSPARRAPRPSPRTRGRGSRRRAGPDRDTRPCVATCRPGCTRCASPGRGSRRDPAPDRRRRRASGPRVLRTSGW